MPETPDDNTDSWPEEQPPAPRDPATMERQELEDLLVRLREQRAHAQDRNWALWEALRAAPRPREWPKAAYWHWWVERHQVLTGRPMPESLIHPPEPRPFIRRDRHAWH